MKIVAITLSMLLIAVKVVFAQNSNETEPPLPEGAVARLGTLQLRHSGEAHSVDFSPDGKTLAVACPYARQVFLFSTETGHRRRILQPQAGSYLMALAYSPDGKTLAVDTSGEDILLFDPETGKQIRSLNVEGISIAQSGCITFSPDGKTIAVARETDFVLVDVETSKVAFRHKSRSEIQELAFSADGKKLVVGTINPGAQIWDLATKKPLHDLDAQKIGFTVAFSPDGKWVATGAAEIILWNAETGKEEFRLSGDDPGELFMKLVFTPDGKSLIAGSQECSVYEWDLKTRTQTQKLDGKLNVLRSIAVSRDASKIAAAFSNNAIRLWDRKSGKMLFADKPAHTDEVEMVAFSPDGQNLLTGSGYQTIHFWESPSGRHLRTLESQNSASLSAFTLDLNQA